MKVLSIFCDESGQQDMSEGYYLMTIVVHDQSVPIDTLVADYERRIASHRLPDIPFHMKDLLHGHGEYDGVDPDVRKGLLMHFNALVRQLPVEYRTFSYSSYDTTRDNLAARMRRDIVNFAYDHLEWFQSFEQVPVYYDEDQQAVTTALHRAFDLILGEQAVEWRLISYRDYRLAQVADYFCSVELARMRYREGSYSRTYRKFYGQSQSFRRNFLKPARRKLIAHSASTTYSITME
ncbi:MAG: ABC transporter [Coriobacteriales bacterium]|nr:ABC transporter [Coriobacteriales bacterium]